MSGQVALISCKLIASNLRSNVWKYDHHHIIWTLDLSPNGKKNSQFCWVFQNLLMLLTYFWRTFSFLSEQAYADGGYYEESYDEGFLEAATKSLEQTWSDMSTFFWKTVEEGMISFSLFLSYLSTINYLLDSPNPTVFENHRKSLIQHCERSEICLHFEWTKVY